METHRPFTAVWAEQYPDLPFPIVWKCMASVVKGKLKFQYQGLSDEALAKELLIDGYVVCKYVGSTSTHRCHKCLRNTTIVNYLAVATFTHPSDFNDCPPAMVGCSKCKIHWVPKRN